MSGIHTVAVNFQHDLRPELGLRHSPKKRYLYRCRFPVKVGDLVIVDSPTTGYTTVKVVDVAQNFIDAQAYKHVVMVIPDDAISDHHAYLAAEQERARIASKIAQDVTRMKADVHKRKEQLRNKILDDLVNQDPELQQLTEAIKRGEQLREAVMKAEIINADSLPDEAKADSYENMSLGDILKAALGG